ncbi:MAG: RidA family protein [Planctomycetota bacterium]|jgi:enamine deaminase RidA (YjgF/YER057c/UK114 family)
MNKETSVTEFVKMRLVEGERFGLGFLTGLKDPELAVEPAARERFADLADVLVRHGIQPIQEKVYGRAERREELLSIRREAYRSAGLEPDDLPVSFHQGKSAEPEAFRGVQIWGAIPHDPDITVTTVPEGRTLRAADFRMLYVPGVRGLTEEGGLADGATAQARRMFLGAEAALEKEAFHFNQVARTWIYLMRLLDWYGDFNHVRNAFFTERGIGADAERSFPASTGIQGMTDGEECSMDLLAVDGPGVVSVPLRRSNRQGSAADYGSSFSRAMSVQVGGLDLIFVSGTASIDPSGASIHIGDPEGQIHETLQCISDLLASRGAGLKDILLATVFGKTPEILLAYPQVVQAGGLPDFPFVPVVADVCRDELLVEIEAVAVVPLQEEPRSDRSTP